MRRIEDVFRYFVDRVNLIISRPGFFGGELAIREGLESLAYVDNRESDLRQLFDGLVLSGAFTSCGVASAFRDCTGMESGDVEFGSVYAWLAFRMGYLQTSRLLNHEQYSKMEAELRRDVDGIGLTEQQVIERFGEPAWRNGGNPNYPAVLMYISETARHPICFDFWNGQVDGDDGTRTCKLFCDRPVLRNVRLGAERFCDQFIFTSIGREMRRSAVLHEYYIVVYKSRGYRFQFDKNQLRLCDGT